MGRPKEFKVKKFDTNKNKIVIEEERKDKKWLLFRNKKILILLLIFLLLILILGLNLAISSLNGSSNPYDLLTSLILEFDSGTADISVNNRKPFTDDNAKYKLYQKYGNIGLKDGVIFEVKEISNSIGIIKFFSDKSAMIIYNDGTITRVSSLDDNTYGVSDDGKIYKDAKTLNVSIFETKNLKDGTIITYYSDGCAIIKRKGEVLLVRDGSNILVSKDNEYIIKINPSGVSFEKEHDNINHAKITYYSDGTILVNIDNTEYVVRNKEDINVDGSSVYFPNNNAAIKIDELKLSDKTIIKYYSDGSAMIITSTNEHIMVRRSGDIILNSKENIIKEIVQDEIGEKVYEKNTPNGEVILIFDDGSAVIKYPDGTSEYIDENSNIKYDNDGNIKDIYGQTDEIEKQTTLPAKEVITIYESGEAVIDYPDGTKIYVNNYNDIKYDESGNINKIDGSTSDVDTSKTLPDGTLITEFENGVVEICEPDGNRYLVSKDDIIYDKDGNIEKIENNPINDTNEKTLPDGTNLTEYENDKMLIEFPDGSVIIVDKGNIKYDEDGNIEEIDTGLVVDMEDDAEENEVENNIKITNPTNKELKYRLVIEETEDYDKYSVKKLSSKFVKYQVDVEYVNSGIKYLDNKIWTIDDILEGGLKIERPTFILYEGLISPKSTVNVSLNMWLDYENMTNDEQNSAFIGTIKAYAWMENK